MGGPEGVRRIPAGSRARRGISLFVCRPLVRSSDVLSRSPRRRFITSQFTGRMRRANELFDWLDDGLPRDLVPAGCK